MFKIIGLFFLILFSNIAYTEQPPYLFEGTHFLADYTQCDHDALIDIPNLRQTMIQAASASGATILKDAEFIFSPDGFTMVILLSESHASIHTYPEQDACFIDLFTCGNNCSCENFAKVIKTYLNPKQVSEKKLTRNEAIQDD